MIMEVNRMKCPICGKENNDQSVYCSGCGAALTSDTSQPANTYQSAPRKKKKKGCAIAAGVVAGIVAVLIIAIAALGDSDSGKSSEPNSGNPPASAQNDPGNQQGTGTIGDYAIEIKEATVTKDYNDKPALVVTFSFTNNSDKEISFLSAVSDKAYQDGVQLQTTIPAIGSDVNTSSQMTDLKPGAGTEVTAIYCLSNTASEVEIEVTDLLELGTDKVVKTFSIAE